MLPPALNSGHLALQWAVPRMLRSCGEYVAYVHNCYFYRNEMEVVSIVIEPYWNNRVAKFKYNTKTTKINNWCWTCPSFALLEQQIAIQRNDKQRKTCVALAPSRMTTFLNNPSLIEDANLVGIPYSWKPQELNKLSDQWSKFDQSIFHKPYSSMIFHVESGCYSMLLINVSTRRRTYGQWWLLFWVLTSRASALLLPCTDETDEHTKFRHARVQLTAYVNKSL